MSKKAHYTSQIRASHGIDEKIIYFSIFDFIFKENICIINEQSFFTPFAIQFSSINTQHHSQHQGRNPSSLHNPYSCQNFHTFLKIRILNSSRFQGILITPLPSWTSQQSIPAFTRSGSNPDRVPKH